MSLVEITDLSKRYAKSGTGGSGRRESGANEFAGVEALSLAVDKGEFFTLLGPSGCGKTTTLRCIAGLLAPDSGEVSVGGRVLYSSKLGVSVPVARRGLGMVFQSYAIWPHLSVYKNVSFPLEVTRRTSGMKKAEIRRRVERVLGVVGLNGLAGRAATELSGGQQQRLALARALVGEPPLLLLDEPLSNLDAKLRDEMRVELRRLCKQFETTMIYVTHDQTEALSMSTRVGVMDGGRVVQIGQPTEVYRRPASRFVGEFIGAANLVGCTVLRPEADGRALVETHHGELVVENTIGLEAGARGCVVMRPEDVKLVSADEGGGRGRWPAKVVARSFMGESIEYLVEVGGSLFRVRRRAEEDHPVGAQGDLVVDEAALVLVSG